MSLRRVGVLLGKEFLQGPRNIIFIWAIVAPIVLSLAVSLIFGSLFTEKPRLGMVDMGGSRLVSMIRELDSVVTREYDTVSGIKAAVESGVVDIGIVLPRDFDASLIQGEETELRAYVWGESLAKHRIILGVTIANLARELAGQEAPIVIETITLGDELSVPWSDRLLPFIVLMAVFLGGLLLPATSVINEKEKRTLEALVVTPATLGDIFVAKGAFGMLLSLFTGVVILILNQSFGAEPGLLVLVLALGALMAAAIGLSLGALMRSITALFTVWKLGGILLFAPAFIYLFPQIPEGIMRVFPTYYLIQPVVELSQRGGGWSEIATNVLILIGLDLILIGVAVLIVRRTKQYAT
jgi:ABC-2 type transport system permease protein